MEWVEAFESKVEVKLPESSKKAKDIIEKIKDNWKGTFLDGGKIIKEGLRTKKLFDLLTELGDKQGYKVYSHSLSDEFRSIPGNDKFVNREWMYDLCWYREDEIFLYGLKSLDLAVESEWRNNRGGDKYGAIKYDFQKLLVANMGLCLMVFKVTEEGRKSLSTYFEQVYEIYEGHKSNILFVAFSQRGKTFYYSYLSPKGKDV